MNELKHRSERKIRKGLRSDVFKDEDGAIDLASIMVGIIVIGLIGGVIAATIFAVIPWAQDNAAKHQLDSINVAENSYRGLASSVPPAIQAGARANSFADSVELETAGLLRQGKTYCAIESADGKNYNAYSQSASGNVFTITDANTKPALLLGSLPSDCQFIADTYTGPYVDPSPKLTTLTYLCDADTTGVLPLYSNVNGKETWSDGVTRTYTAASGTTSRTLNAGVAYTATFDGTYNNFGQWSAQPSPFSKCLTAVTHWGSTTGVTSSEYAFYGATKLTDVPRNIPTTITNMYSMFNGAKTFNDPDISRWDVSNVTTTGGMFASAETFNQSLNSWTVSKITSMDSMFSSAKAFNQPLNNWNVSNVSNMDWMFADASAFNQPLNSWNMSKVAGISYMFRAATSFDQPLSNWNTANITRMDSAFSSASAFNQPIGNWNVSNVANTSYMFEGASTFNQPLNTWNMSKVTNMNGMFAAASVFNQPIGNWNVISVTSMSGMFDKAHVFNQPLNTWNVSNVTNLSWMFSEAHAFNQPLNSWVTSKVISMQGTFYNARVFNQDISVWNTSSVTNMSEMFSNAFAFNEPLNNWTVSNVTNMSYMFYDAYAFNQPLNNWSTGKVTNMSYMFYDTTIFVQNLSGWSTVSLTSGTYFAPTVNFPVSYKPAGTTLY